MNTLSFGRNFWCTKTSRGSLRSHSTSSACASWLSKSGPNWYPLLGGESFSATLNVRAHKPQGVLLWPVKQLDLLWQVLTYLNVKTNSAPELLASLPCLQNLQQAEGVNDIAGLRSASGNVKLRLKWLLNWRRALRRNCWRGCRRVFTLQIL